ncbi:MAG: ASTRA complex subunit [Geoglossum umbratile]|nr:MAG: ASTRA complex subunit [Geoglossum umbratile]
MVMALAMFHQAMQLTVVAGYESGHTIVLQHSNGSAGAKSTWRRLCVFQPHSQPVLSLDISPSKTFYCTSSADAVIAKHPLLPGPHGSVPDPLNILHTNHSGQQGLKFRSDGTIFATAGWDSKIRVYAAGSMKELAVLKWHTAGCYAVAFAELHGGETKSSETADPGPAIGANEIARTQREQPLIRAVEQRRIDRVKSTHWLAAGSKDGKVSLWDIY